MEIRLQVKQKLNPHTFGLLDRRLNKFEWVNQVWLQDHSNALVIHFEENPDAESTLIYALLSMGYQSTKL